MNLRSTVGVMAGMLVVVALTAVVAAAVLTRVGGGSDGRAQPSTVTAAAVAPAIPTGPVPTVPDTVRTAPRVAPPVAKRSRRSASPAAVADLPANLPRSRALGKPNRGALAAGVLFPASGRDVTTWDALLQRRPNRDWRRVGTDRLVRTILTVAADYRRAHPGAPRVVVSDLSLPQGGEFGAGYGGLGHASHQNGLDVDIAYPRRDRQEIGVDRVSEIDRPLAQALVNAFVAAGAQFVFVGPRTGLRGPEGVVETLVNHDDHLHVRIPNVR